MKLVKIIVSAALATCLTATAAFAAPAAGSEEPVNPAQQSDTSKKGKMQLEDKEFRHRDKGIWNQQDPVKALQSRKEKIQSKLKDGKISKEKADKITAKIDTKIKEIQEFNKLTLQQKKDKLESRFKSSLDKRIKNGKLTQDKADKLLKDYSDRLKSWDGKGYPMPGKRGSGEKYKQKSNEKE